MTLIVQLWRKYQEAQQFRKKGSDESSKARQEELSELGIMEVRPRSEKTSGEGQAPPTAEEEPPASPAPSPPDSPAESRGAPSAPASTAEETDTDEAAVGETAEMGSSEAAVEETAETGSGEADALTPYLESLRAALDAYTVGLLVQEEVALRYRIEAIVSQSDRVRTTGTFETEQPLLTASMSRHAVTIQAVGEDEVTQHQLGYYEEAEAVERIALAPVPAPEGHMTYFLVVDAKSGNRLEARRTQRLLARFAELLGRLLEFERTEPEPESFVDPSVDQAAEKSTEAPRPRRDIIAEEMEQARQEARDLALALVYLNRAESIARDGDGAVATAEEALRTQLEQLAPRSRVERFGELTFGVFYSGNAANVEPWAERLQEEMGAASGTLEGGVSIGVALLADRHDDPDVLREDATEALRVAYETGTCTIVE